MSSTLENRYRGMLRLYPRRWREENGNAVIGTLLDVAEAEQRTRPTRRERLDLVASAIEAHLSGLGSPAVRSVIAGVSLSIGAVIAWASFVFSTLMPWAVWHHFGQTTGTPPTAPGIPPALLAFAWTVALVGGLTRNRRLTVIALVLASVFAIVGTFASYHHTLFWDAEYPSTPAFLALAALTALVGQPHRGAIGLGLAGMIGGSVFAFWYVIPADFSGPAVSTSNLHQWDALRFGIWGGMLNFGNLAWPCILVTFAAMAMTLAQRTKAATAMLLFLLPWFGAWIADGVKHHYLWTVGAIPIAVICGCVAVFAGIMLDRRLRERRQRRQRQLV